MTQEYLQSRQHQTRKIYIKVNDNDLKTFGIGADLLLEHNKPLRGLCDAGDYWGVTIKERICNDLGMTSTPGDASLYVKNSDGSLKEIAVSNAGDYINAGAPAFQMLTKKPRKSPIVNPDLTITLISTVVRYVPISDRSLRSLKSITRQISYIVIRTCSSPISDDIEHFFLVFPTPNQKFLVMPIRPRK